MNCAAGRTMMYGVMAVNPAAGIAPSSPWPLPFLLLMLLCLRSWMLSFANRISTLLETLRLEARAILVPRASGSQFAIRRFLGPWLQRHQHPLHRFIQLQREERLAMAALHLRPQILYGAQLQLLYSAFRLPQALSNLSNASLLHKSLYTTCF